MKKKLFLIALIVLMTTSCFAADKWQVRLEEVTSNGEELIINFMVLKNDKEVELRRLYYHPGDNITLQKVKDDVKAIGLHYKSMGTIESVLKPHEGEIFDVE